MSIMKAIRINPFLLRTGVLLALLLVCGSFTAAQSVFRADTTLAVADRHPLSFQIPQGCREVDVTVRFSIGDPSLFGPSFFSPADGASLYESRLLTGGPEAMEYELKYRPLTGYPSAYNAYVPAGSYIARISRQGEMDAHELRFAFVINNLVGDYTLDTPVPYNGSGHVPSPDPAPSYATPSPGRSMDRSHILRRDMLDTSGNLFLETLSYFDGLGRPVQTLRAGASPSGADLADFTDYDRRGRVWRVWRQVPVSGLDGAFVSDLPERAVSFTSDSRPYEETLREESPLGRPLQVTGVGSAWSGHPSALRYGTNDADSPLLSCRRFTVTSSGVLSDGGLYPSGSLEVVRSTDEDGHVRLSFLDKQGRTLLDRGVLSGDSYADTYYVYDSRGLLRHVLTPAMGSDFSSSSLASSGYSYSYDGLGRLTCGRRPGCGETFYEYDAMDRLVFSQDGVQRASGRWSYYLYDAFGRLTEEGECTVKSPLGGKTVHVRHLYDSYGFLGTEGFTGSVYPAATVSGQGKLTGRVLLATDGSGTAQNLYTAYYYDTRGRVTQAVQSNLLGGHDVTHTVYTFTGKPAVVSHTHTAGGKPTLTEVTEYTYDHAERLTKVEHTLGGVTVTLVSNTYDELGRLQSMSPHGNASQKLTYAYNLRDWLTGISGSKFSQNLYYNTGNGTPCYNGNISGMTWQAGNETTTRGYKFTYDGLNRLLDAVYGEGTNIGTNAGRFTEKVTSYDKNGNILSLQRYGQTGASSYGLIDNLTFTLNGNQLNRVDDASTATAYNNGFEFKDAVKQANEYAYDANGNLTKDLNRNISNIQYNFLNLPGKVTFGDGSTIEYVYAADGTKLRTKHVINGTTTTTDYCGNVVYENGVQKLLLTEAGYVTLSDRKYHYYLQDHQGNNRVVLNQDGTVEEVNHYYPFGGLFANSTNVQPYKYNGKELDTKNGLNWYDYGARHYDPALGRFMTVDRYAEKYSSMSPYQYAANSPVMNIDVNGDSVRVYTETTSNHGLGHAWISAGEGDDIIVYTYGRYDGTNKGANGSFNSLADGPGVLVRLTGEEALSYNKEKSLSTEVSTFTISDISDDELIDVLDTKFYSSSNNPSNPMSEYYNSPNARIIDQYHILNNNCAVMVSNALHEAGSKMLNEYMLQPTKTFGQWTSVLVPKVYISPLGLQNHMKSLFKYTGK